MPLPSDPLKWAIDAFRDGRNQTYDTYAAYLAGDTPLAFASEKFRSAFGRLFESFTYNRCEMVVDAHADRLQLQGFGADNEAIAQAAQDLWDANHMDLREGHIEADAFGLGDAYLIVEMHPERGQVQMWVQDPRTVRVHYADDVPGELDLAAKLWIDADLKRARLNLYFRDRVEKYASTSRTLATSGIATQRAFEPYQPEGEAWPMPLEITDTVPVFHIANNGRTNAYGVSELRSVLPLQDAINKTLMDLLVASEFAAFPQRVFIGLEVGDTPEDKAKLQAIEAGITRAITLEDSAAKIAEFSAADLSQYLEVLEFLDSAICRVTKVPRQFLGLPQPAESGVSKLVDHSPFTTKMEDRARAVGQVLSAAQAYGLRLLGYAVDPGDLRVNWAPLAPITDQDRWDLIQRKVDAGMPFVSALREDGYEPEQIDEIRDEKREEAETAARDFSTGRLPELDEVAD